MGVISGAHRLAVSRVAAAMVALALSGAPRLALPGETAPASRCCCPKQAVRHACPCAAHRASRAAGSGGAQRPCHGVAPEAARKGESGTGLALTWFRPGCGTPEAAVARPSGIDAFTIPESLAVAPALVPERMPEPRRTPADLPVEPETPPPIAA